MQQDTGLAEHEPVFQPEVPGSRVEVQLIKWIQSFGLVILQHYSKIFYENNVNVAKQKFTNFRIFSAWTKVALDPPLQVAVSRVGTMEAGATCCHRVLISCEPTASVTTDHCWILI